MRTVACLGQEKVPRHRMEVFTNVRFTNCDHDDEANRCQQSVYQVGAPKAITNERRKLAREAIDRHVLAASAIRAWVARASLVRRLHRSRRSRDDLQRRWEPEIHRIAATRIQALARGAVKRLERWKAEKAAVEIQRVERGWRGRLIMNELAHKRYATSCGRRLNSRRREATTRSTRERRATEASWGRSLASCLYSTTDKVRPFSGRVLSS